jgi:hypothetical protein
VLFDVHRLERRDANSRNATTDLGARVPRAKGNIPSTPDIPVASLSDTTGMSPRSNEADQASRESRGFDFDRPGSQSEGATSGAQRSNLVGELWLDTLSLREWLRTYLSGEMGFAMQATNRFGTAFE